MVAPIRSGGMGGWRCIPFRGLRTGPYSARRIPCQCGTCASPWVSPGSSRQCELRSTPRDDGWPAWARAAADEAPRGRAVAWQAFAVVGADGEETQRPPGLLEGSPPLAALSPKDCSGTYDGRAGLHNCVFTSINASVPPVQAYLLKTPENFVHQNLEVEMIRSRREYAHRDQRGRYVGASQEKN